MNEQDARKLLDGLTNYVSGTYESTDGYALIRLDQEGKVSGSYFAPDSEKAAKLESVVAPKLLEAGADLEQLAQWGKITKLEGSGE